MLYLEMSDNQGLPTLYMNQPKKQRLHGYKYIHQLYDQGSIMIHGPSVIHHFSDASWHSKDFLGSNNSRCEHSSGIQVRGLSFGAPNALLPPSQKRKRKLHTKSKQKNTECEPHESETNNKMPRCLVKLFSWKFRHPRMNKNNVIKHLQKNNWYDFNHLQSPQSSPTLAALIVLEARISCAGFSLTPLGAHFLPKACGKSWLQNASNHMAICWGSYKVNLIVFHQPGFP